MRPRFVRSGHQISDDAGYPAAKAGAVLLLARTRDAINFSRGPALLIGWYFRCAAEKQSADRCGGRLLRSRGEEGGGLVASVLGLFT